MKNFTYLILLIFIGLFSCQNNNSKSKEITDSTPENSIKKEEIEETNFDKFFQKYRSDSVFQVNHTKFPLKCVHIELEEITTTFTKKNDWKFNNFEDNRKTEYDQYEYVKEIGNANLVLYEMRGIDNGILVIYKFMFNNQKWMLEEIENASN
ncbi:DUF4348 domain-containing protein [Bernardetia sp. Wsw4-3y2]|uniref:DUF4348 domain-containing protein n=1 Tax=Bernardetia sp. Wsw4-3y2 TaxID=3127471 RepID=UPI0030D35835